MALSGTPLEPPPQLDAQGNPILQKNTDEEETSAKSDKTADGIGLVDVAGKKFLRKIPAGSDPEQFVLNGDGSRIYIANEDVGAATVLNATNGKAITFVPVSREPEGVGLSPDEKFFYVTCETAGDVYAIDNKTYKVFAHFMVHPRPAQRGVSTGRFARVYSLRIRRRAERGGHREPEGSESHHAAQRLAAADGEDFAGREKDSSPPPAAPERSWCWTRTRANC